LAQAYNWLKSQPPVVRERAQSADALVSLFLHSKRFGNATVSPWDQDSDVGAQAFKSDLKNLAQGFKDFESNVVEHMVAQPSPAPPPSQATATATTQTVQTVTTTQVKATSNNSLGKELDMRTIEVLRDVQLRLNLQSEMDALRVLVVLGYDKIKSILPMP
jgi:hypothetical protein